MMVVMLMLMLGGKKEYKKWFGWYFLFRQVCMS